MLRRSLLLLVLLAGCSVQERKAAPVVEDRDTAAVVSRIKAIPGLGTRLHPDAALVPATLGVKLDKLDPKVDLDVIVPLTARGPLRIARSEGLVLDVNAAHDKDVRGLIESGAMVFVAASADHDAAMIAEPARFTDLHVLRSAAANTVRLQLRLGDGLASARVAGNAVELVARSGSVWLRTEPLEAVDASGAHKPLTPKLEGDPRTPQLVLTVESGGTYPKGVAVSWAEPKA